MTFAVWNIVADNERKPVDIATLLGVPIGVVGLAIAVKPVERNGVELARGRAGKLAGEVKKGESRVRRQLLGSDVQRINLTYVLHSMSERAATAPPAGRTFADGPATLPDVLEYYRSTRPRRLVVTGAAGAGKTVLALELMLALIEDRAEGDPVPVRISLAQWDTDQPLTDVLARRLAEAYGWPAGTAAGLVEHGMVLPVLDGLDEMDPLRPDGTPDPDAPRARAVLEALNTYQDGRNAGSLVLTCRTAHYDALAPTDRLIDAARIAVAPVDADHAVTYLRARAIDTPRWQPLIDHLETQPASPLTTTLSTPWRLCLTATVYHRDGDPSELLHHTDGHDLDEYLLTRYVPATVANTPNPRGYRPEDVHRWLHHLTGHLTGAPSTDLTLHRLWTLAGTTRVRIADIVLTTLAVAAVLAFAFVGLIEDEPFPTTLFAALAAFAGIASFRPTPGPNRLRIPRGTLQRGFRARFWAGSKIWFAVGFAIGVAMLVSFEGRGWYALAELFDLQLNIPNAFPGIELGVEVGLVVGCTGGIMAGLTGGFATGFSTWFRVWFALGLAYGLGASDFGSGLMGGLRLGLFVGLVFALAGGLIGGFVNGLKEEPTTVANPWAIVRDDMAYGLVIGPLAGLMAGLMVGFTMWVRGGAMGAVVVAVVGLVVGCASGLAGAARRYGVFLLCSRGKLPFRLAVFLDWAVTAGLLRYSGPSYQFRHRELQQWLTRHSRP
ncbi:NACHT domain-containing protein [Streptomyces sp. NPDC047917]|uniref:NACHT domain-containing protein n=1 Tax=Streptomyces sp. NPDC047917 TaxID=3365491 RepID=UPI003723EF80